MTVFQRRDDQLPVSVPAAQRHDSDTRGASSGVASHIRPRHHILHGRASAQLRRLCSAGREASGPQALRDVL